MDIKILFGVPTNDYVLPQTVFEIVKICAHSKVGELDPRDAIDYIGLTGSPTDQVRNGMVKTVLADPQYTHLMMMDSDIVPPDNIVQMMLDCDAPVATAICPIMLHGQIVTNIQITTDDEPDGHFMTSWGDKKEPFEVKGTGAGLLLIKREVFEKMPWPWFRYQELKDGTRVGEDIDFSRKCEKLGLVIKTHPNSVCGHIKRTNLMLIVDAKNRGDL